MAPPDPPLLGRRSSDEYAPLPPSREDHVALQTFSDRTEGVASLGLTVADYALDRRGTAATLRALDEAHGGGFFDIPREAESDLSAAEAAFRGGAPVVDVQTHLVDPGRWDGEGSAALSAFLRLVDPERWTDPIDPRATDAAAWAALVFGASETAVALLTSTPGPPDRNVLSNPQIAAAREVVDRYAGTGRVLTHAIVHPNLGEHELDSMVDWRRQLSPSGWKCYTLWGPPTRAVPDGGWFLDDEEIGFPFLERVRSLGPPVVAAHKGISGPIPGAGPHSGSPRDVGPAAAAFPDITFVVYHSGYERDPDGEEGPYDPESTPQGVDRLVYSLAQAGVPPGANVYAELGTTWYLMLRRPAEAAHVLGKLLASVGPERILWGTDSVWYGSPQPLIDAFRAFSIPTSFRERWGYPELTSEMKDLIMSGNAQRVYGVTDEQLTAATAQQPSWVPNAAVELRRELERARVR
jgi:predicted TIM-barrel fold metal-dependent hydrolase